MGTYLTKNFGVFGPLKIGNFLRESGPEELLTKSPCELPYAI